MKKLLSLSFHLGVGGGAVVTFNEWCITNSYHLPRIVKPQAKIKYGEKYMPTFVNFCCESIYSLFEKILSDYNLTK